MSREDFEPTILEFLLSGTICAPNHGTTAIVSLAVTEDDIAIE